MTTELQIPIEIIQELISSVNKTEYEYWDEVKEIDGIKDYDSLEPVLRITEYINSHLNTPLKCGSFRIMRYDKIHLRYYNLDNEVPEMNRSMDTQKLHNPYYIYFDYKNAHFYIEAYCERTKYLWDERDYTVFDLDGNNLYSCLYQKNMSSEGYYSIRCINALAKIFADIDEVFESKKLDFSKDFCIVSFESVDDEEIGEIYRIVNSYLFTDGKQIEPLIKTMEFCTLLLEQDGFQALVEDENGSFLTATIEKTELEICIESLLEINKDKKVQDACQIIKDILQKEKETDLFAFSFREN